MVNKELVDYIKRQLSYGHDSATIREHLLKHGYTEAVADEALHTAAPPQKQKIPGLRYLPFSSKKIGLALLVLIILGGIGFAAYQMFSPGKDLTGAAKEPIEIVSEEIQEEESPEEEQIADIEDVSEEAVEEEESEEIEETEETEETPEQEEAFQEQIKEETVSVTGCMSDSVCDSGDVCYQKVCVIDNDRDSLSDDEEATKETDPHDQDSDDDGLFDGDEIAGGTDALDAADPGYTSCRANNDCASGQVCAESGICLTCEDSDDINYKKRGTTKGVHYIYTSAIYSQDTCNTAGQLVEYYCRSDYYLYSETVDCETAVETGYTCSNGKCVEG